MGVGEEGRVSREREAGERSDRLNSNACSVHNEGDMVQRRESHEPVLAVMCTQHAAALWREGG